MKESIEIDMVKNLLSETHSFVCVLEGENHKVKYANKTFRDQSSIGSMIDQPVTKMFHEESSYQHIVNKLDEVYKCGTDYKESEVPIHDEKGNLCFINIFCKPYKITSTSINGVFIEIWDVTDGVVAKKKLKKTLEEREILIKELHHRVKNNLALVCGMLDLEILNQNTESSEKNVLQEAKSRIHSIASIHEMLYQTKNFKDIQLDNYIKKLIKYIENSHAESFENIRFNFNLTSFTLNINKAIPVGIILNELIINSAKHAFSDKENGTITINLSTNNDNVTLTVKDSGNGIPEDFDFSTSNSLGLKIIDQLTTQLEGKLDINTQQVGTAFILSFPLIT